MKNIPIKAGDKDYQGFVLMVKAVGLPSPIREYRFKPPRRWRLDFAWPDQRLAVEVEGGWQHGGHRSIKRYLQDIEKYNMLSVCRFFLMRFTPQMMKSGHAVSMVEEWFETTREEDAKLFIANMDLRQRIARKKM